MAWRITSEQTIAKLGTYMEVSSLLTLVYEHTLYLRNSVWGRTVVGEPILVNCTM